MKILFISHSYPPILGGVESQNFNLVEGLSKIAVVKIIANRQGKFWLPFFIPWAFLKAFFVMTKCDVCLLGSGVLSPVGALLKFFHPKKKFFCIIHGLDVTYASRENFLAKVYKKINIPSLNKMTGIFAVSNATKKEAADLGVDQDKIRLIPNGINPEELAVNCTRKDLSNLFGRNVDDKKVILRLGRFVPHKGTDWFIENVMPKLPEDVVMIAAGSRVSKNAAGDTDSYLSCEQAVIDNHLENRVKLMPSLPWNDLKILLNTVDLVVAPNVKITGTMEGFGINTIEAGVCKRVVLASNLEGLADAVQNGKNGILVEPENTDQWVKKINAVFGNGPEFLEKFGERISYYVKENFTWKKICQKYLEEMGK